MCYEAGTMGVYTEYLDRQMPFPDLVEERKKQLMRISALRGRQVLVFAADLNKGRSPISINYSDLLPIHDQIEALKGAALDLILETPGGSGEAAEDIVRLLRGRFGDLGVIVPGWAKSAGTIITMAADEILMGPLSALGPIDAQITWQGKVFSADALLEGFEKIKAEVEGSGSLNRAYIPILQGISPGELQSAQNALDFAKRLVTEWLAQFKFRDWMTHASTGQPVTDKERQDRAKEIAGQLCNHKHWLTHGRSIRLDDLARMRLRVTDYDKSPDLADAINRYYTLLQMTFATNIYKLFETPESQVYRFESPAIPAPTSAQAGEAVLDLKCNHCGSAFQVQANLGRVRPLKPGCLPFPPDNRLECPSCKTPIDLSDARRQLEAQTKLPVVS